MLLRESERGLNPLSRGGVEASSRKFSKVGCFLPQSRYSSTLFPGLLTQEVSDWHQWTHQGGLRLLGLTIQIKRPPICSRGGVDGHLRTQCPTQLWNRPKLRNTLGWRGSCRSFHVVIVRAMSGSHPCLTSTARPSTGACGVDQPSYRSWAR